MSKQQAIDQFTDRAEPQKAFAQQYLAMTEAAKDQPSRVLTYYGIGGIGKSTLLTKLEDNLTTDPDLARHSGKKPLVINFNLETKQEDIQVLTALRNLLCKEYGWKFPKFEVALYLYYQRIGEDAHAPEDGGYLEQSGLKTMVDVAADLPVVGSVVKILSFIDKGQAAVRNMLKSHSSQVKEMNEMTTEEQREKLPYYFAMDLSAHTAKSAAPLVIMLDTFECIAETASTTDSLMGRDYWLYNKNGLIANAKNTLFVLASRRKIAWEDISFSLEQHLLGSLSQEDSASFLSASGIPENLLPHLCKLTDGIPVYLDVCVQQYHQLRRKNITPEPNLFGGSQKKLIQCYVRYMDKSEKELVQMLSFLPEWDRELVRTASIAVFNRFSPADFKRIISLSITTEAAPGRYFIHRTVAEILRNDEDNELQDDTAKFIVEHYTQVLETADPYSEEYAAATYALLYGAILLHPDRDALADYYRAHIEQYLSVLSLYRQGSSTLRCVELLWKTAQEKENDRLYAMALGEKFWLSSKALGLSAAAYDEALQALKLHVQLQGEASMETLTTLSAIAVFLTIRYPYDAIPINKHLIAMFQTHHPDNKEKLFNAQWNLANCYKRMLNLTEAEKLYEALEKACRAHYGNEDSLTIRAILNLARCYQQQEYFKKALPLAEEAVALSRQVLKQHPYTYAAIETLAELYDQTEKQNLSSPLWDELAAHYTQHSGATHIHTIKYLKKASNSYVATENYERAADAYETVFRRQAQETPNYEGYWSDLEVLAPLLVKAKRYEPAAECYQELLNHSKNATNADPRRALDLLGKLLTCYNKLGDDGQIQKRISRLEEYLQNDPSMDETNIEIWFILGFAYLLLKDGREKGFFILNQATDYWFENLPAHIYPIDRLSQLLNFFEACHMYKEATDLCLKYRAYCLKNPLENTLELCDAIVISGRFMQAQDPDVDLLAFFREQIESFSLFLADAGGFPLPPEQTPLAILAELLIEKMCQYPQLKPIAESLLILYINKLDNENIPIHIDTLKEVVLCYKTLGQWELVVDTYMRLYRETNDTFYASGAIEILRKLGHNQEADELESRITLPKITIPAKQRLNISKYLSVPRLMSLLERLRKDF